MILNVPPFHLCIQKQAIKCQKDKCRCILKSSFCFISMQFFQRKSSIDLTSFLFFAKNGYNPALLRHLHQLSIKKCKINRNNSGWQKKTIRFQAIKVTLRVLVDYYVMHQITICNF